MADICIFQFIACEGPGYLGDYLQRRGYSYRIIEINRGAPVPSSIDGVRGLVFMGGPMSVNDDLPWIAPILRLIRAASAVSTPVLGHCLGGQLIAKALGAPVMKHATREIGWFPVRRLVPLPSLAREFEAFHWHGDTFKLPSRAQRLFESDACANQGFRIGSTLALQFHLEMLPSMVRTWAERYAHEIVSPSPTVQSSGALVLDLSHRIERLHRVADAIYGSWCDNLE